MNIGGKNAQSIIYDNVTEISGFIPAIISTTQAMEGMEIVTMLPVEGITPTRYTYKFASVTTTPKTLILNTGFFSGLGRLQDKVPKLAEGSRDVELINQQNLIGIIVTGPNPVMVFDAEE